MRSILPILLLALMFGSGCRKIPDPTPMLNHIGEEYVKLALAIGTHDRNYVDAYFGPPQWKEQAVKDNLSLYHVRADALVLQQQLANTDVSEAPQEVKHRHLFLTKQLAAMVGRLDYLAGVKMTFDQETRLLYDAVEPVVPESHYAAIVAEIGKLLPGGGSVAERVEAERRRFAVPKDKLLEVFKAAIDEARRRTLQHISLPPDESFEVELVSNKPWSAYNWYQGNAHSLIQVNTDLPVDIDFAIHLACHEGYPGHHVYNTLLERKLRNERGWIEYSIYPLFSPESLIAEGTAEYGVDLVLPPADRLKFLREVLYPLAGLNPANAERHLRLTELTGRLQAGEGQAARDYLDGKMSREDTIQWMMKFSLLSRERAEKRMSFIDTYRGYIINYGYGKQLVAEYMKAKGATASRPDAAWKLFETLLSTPVVPSQLNPTPTAR